MITVGYIKQNLNQLDDDLLMYSSNYTKEYTIEVLSSGYINMFNPIINIHGNSNGEFIADFSWDNKSKPKTLSILHVAIEQHCLSDNIELERDVEDGYVYDAYEHCFYNDKFIVFA